MTEGLLCAHTASRVPKSVSAETSGAVPLGRNLEHNFIVGRRESEIADMHHVVTLFGEPNRQCRREGVVDKKPQEARIRGNSRSRKLSAA